jgi:uncharacterized repeat protein (TIGR01451 family)
VAADLTGSVTNSAVVDSPTEDPDPSDNADSTTTTSEPSADVSIVKTIGSELVPGLPVTYTFVITNDGPSSAANVVVDDPMAPGLTPTGVSSTDGLCAIVGGAVECSLDTMAPGDTATVTVDVDTDPAIVADVTNTATVTTETPDPDPDDNESSNTSTPAPEADVSIVKTAPDTATGTDTVVFGLAVTSAGPSVATNVVVTDELPIGVTFVEADGCTEAAGVVTCDVGDLDPGESVSYEITVTVDSVLETIEIENVSTVSSDTPDPAPGNNESTTETMVTPLPGTLVGVVWNDRDGDGVQDPGEFGIPGVTVIITGDPDGDGEDDVFTVVTDSNGNFSVDLPPGEYEVEVDLDTVPAGLAPTTGQSGSYVVDPGETTEVEFGEAGGTVTGLIWADIDGDGVQDEGEADLRGVVVRLVCVGADGIQGTADDILRSTVTQSPYTFVDVPVGQECFAEVDTTTLPPNIDENTFDLDGDKDNRTAIIVDAPGDTVTGVDFGYTPGEVRLPPTGNTPGRTLQVALLLVVVGLGLAYAGRRRWTLRGAPNA